MTNEPARGQALEPEGPPGSTGLSSPKVDAPFDAERKLRELEFLHEFAKLLTTARNWDELMRTIVDRTTTALDVDVCSVYLMERDESCLRLAATNGLDRDQIGRVTLGMGEGLTGRAALIGRPVASPDVRVDPRFKWVPGFDQSQFVSMLSVPLPWNDTVIGVINVQAIETRLFSPEEVEFLVTIGALLGGIVEKGRLQAEAEEQLETLTALDGARAELLAVVTHELRTPLAVVRAYVDLLADAAGDSAAGARPDPELVDEWRSQAIGQVTRLDRLVDSILASVRGEGLAAGLARVPFDVARAVNDTIGEMTPLLREHPLRRAGTWDELVGLGDEGRFRQVLEHLLENEVKYSPENGSVSVGAWRKDGEVQVYVTDDGAGIPEAEWESVFDAYVRTANRPRGSGIGLYAARRLMNAMGGRVWLESNGYGGSRFMVAVPEMRDTSEDSGGPEAGVMSEAGSEE
ncbi:MAG: HAMP domain-containing sensor histidine kinase [Candidatus Limnocylindrales bacterium]|jgi:signal transduction histidine kinase